LTLPVNDITRHLSAGAAQMFQPGHMRPAVGHSWRKQ